MIELVNVLYKLSYNLWEKEPFWIGVIIECIVIALILFKRAQGLELEVTKKVFHGYAYFLIGFAITRLLFILSDFERDINDVSKLYTQIVILAYISSIIAFMALARVVEIHLLKSKIQFTTKLMIVMITFLLIMFVFASIYFNSELIITITRIGLYTVEGIAALLVIIFYVKLIMQTVGSVRKKFAINFLGIFLLFLGLFLDSEIFQWLFPIWVYPILSGVGILIFVISQKKE
ncbi:MAG: hypothetical protein ACTSPD_20705 [Promethearchaeota archaeon]